jgi:hypothetical protein
MTQIARIANADTPSNVEVPDTWNGIIIWAVGRFGSGIIMAAAFAYAASVVYKDDHLLIDRVMTAFEARSKTDTELAAALTALTRQLADMRDEVRDAHLRASAKPVSKP